MESQEKATEGTWERLLTQKDLLHQKVYNGGKKTSPTAVKMKHD